MNRKLPIVAAMLALAAPLAAHAQDAGGLTLADAADSGDTAWLLAAAVLAIAATLPGVALFHAARARANAAASVALQVGAIAALVSLLWVVVGYTLAFGNVTGGWLGGGAAWMLINLGNVRDGTTVPESAFVLFRAGFAMLAPALMTGAWAGRARFGWVLGFAALWSVIVFAPVAHWVWGGGWLAAKLGTIDYAGGIVVCTTAGVSALVAALLMGKGLAFSSEPTEARAPVLAVAGAMLLWLGWFGLTGGSALAATDDAASAMINVHVAASAAALVWLLIERLAGGKPGAAGFATGATCGLAAILPAAGFVSPGAAMLIGLVAAPACYAAARLMRTALHIDDTLGVFAVFGVGGMLGAVLAGLFAAPSFGGIGFAQGMGLARQLFAQVAGVGVVALWSAVATAICALMVSMVIPMRLSEDDESAASED